jgi:hypothetical protein
MERILNKNVSRVSVESVGHVVFEIKHNGNVWYRIINETLTEIVMNNIIFYYQNNSKVLTDLMRHGSASLKRFQCLEAYDYLWDSIPPGMNFKKHGYTKALIT